MSSKRLKLTDIGERLTISILLTTIPTISNTHSVGRIVKRVIVVITIEILVQTRQTTQIHQLIDNARSIVVIQQKLTIVFRITIPMTIDTSNTTIIINNTNIRTSSHMFYLLMLHSIPNNCIVNHIKPTKQSMKNTPQNALVHTPTDSNCQRIANAHTIFHRGFFHNLLSG